MRGCFLSLWLVLLTLLASPLLPAASAAPLVAAARARRQTHSQPQPQQQQQQQQQAESQLRLRPSQDDHLLAAAGSTGAPSSPLLPNPLRPLRRRTQRMLRSDAARHLIAGAAAGVVSNTIVAPLDIIRINLMVSPTRSTPLRVAKQIYAGGGLPAFWQGNLADVYRTIPASAVRFYSFAVYKLQLPQHLGAMGLNSGPAVVSLLAGGFAGMTAMALLFPLETVRTQMATASALKGVGILGFSKSLVAKEGVRGLYRGLPASLVSVMPYFSVRFGVYDMLRRWHIAIADGDLIPAQFSAAYGFAAGFAASGLTFPFEVVRRRAMVGAFNGGPLLAVPAIVRAEGLAGLYKGYFVNVVKVAPSSAITFLTYESVRQLLDRIAFAPEPPSKQQQQLKQGKK